MQASFFSSDRYNHLIISLFLKIPSKPAKHKHAQVSIDGTENEAPLNIKVPRHVCEASTTHSIARKRAASGFQPLAADMSKCLRTDHN